MVQPPAGTHADSLRLSPLPSPPPLQLPLAQYLLHHKSLWQEDPFVVGPSETLVFAVVTGSPTYPSEGLDLPW